MLQAPRERLVGRDGELRRLLGLLDDAAAGQPAHALISGDAGVGKTRLVAELAARAADRGFMVLSGRCAELGDSIPYLPLADALREGTAGMFFINLFIAFHNFFEIGDVQLHIELDATLIFLAF